MTEQEARNLLEIGDAFTPQDLKTAFRKASMTKHPDIGGSQEDFIALMGAFDLLKPLASATGAATGELKKITTVDGRPLSELGKGYPITISARTCDSCNGLGYREFHEQRSVMATCKRCGGCGMVRYPCKRCGGDGKYKHPRSGKVVGECHRCKGSGWFYPEDKRRHRGTFGVFERVVYIPGTDRPARKCGACNGLGRSWQEIDQGGALYAECMKCHGVGEIKMGNPVIPRGYFRR